MHLDCTGSAICHGYSLRFVPAHPSGWKPVKRIKVPGQLSFYGKPKLLVDELLG